MAMMLITTTAANPIASGGPARWVASGNRASSWRHTRAMVLMLTR